MLYIGLAFAFPLVLDLFGMLGRSRVLALFPFFGAILGVYAFLGVGVDGSLTNSFTSPATILASAPSNAFTWYAVTILPLMIAIIGFCLAIYKAVRG